MPERVEFNGNHVDNVSQGFELQLDGLNIRLDGRVRLVVGEADGGDLVVGASQSILDPLDRVIGSLRRHRAERNRSGGERQGAVGAEPTGELGEDRQVGVELDSPDATNSEGK